MFFIIQNLYFIQTLVFTFFSYSRIPSKRPRHIQLSCHASFSFPRLTVSWPIIMVIQTICVVDDLDSFEECQSDILIEQHPLLWICLMLFSWLERHCGFEGGRPQHCHCHHLISRVTYSQCDLSLLTLILITQLRSRLSEYSTAKLLIFQGQFSKDELYQEMFVL